MKKILETSAIIDLIGLATAGYSVVVNGSQNRVAKDLIEARRDR